MQLRLRRTEKRKKRGSSFSPTNRRDILELHEAPGAAFRVSSNAERPKSAALRPPSPFSGYAHYRRVGSIRAPARGRLTGSLLVSIYGVEARLAGPGAKASLFSFNPGF